MCDHGCEDCPIDKLAAIREDVQFAMDTAHQASREAAESREEIAALREENETLRERVAEVEKQLQESLDKPYAQLSKREKAVKIQQYAIQRAEKKSTGKHALDYDDIKWSVFDGEASDGHTYNLIRLAAQRSGFEQLEDPKRVAVDLARLNDSNGRSVVNNATQEVDG